jgi:urea carboxylase
MTIPGVDILGSKTGYSASRPWLFEDFDQITFYEVTEEEYEKQMAIFHSGRYEYQWEQVEFDMKEHNKLLVDTKDQVKEIRKKQKRAQEEMNKLEKATMEKWMEEKKKNEISEDTIESLLNGKILSHPSTCNPKSHLLRCMQTPILSLLKHPSMQMSGRYRLKKATRSRWIRLCRSWRR